MPTSNLEKIMSDINRPPLTFSFFPEVPQFLVTSTDVADGVTLPQAQVADSMGYSGSNQSPQLSWSGFPSATKSFAITIHDPDAPTGSGFWHWVVANIPVNVHELSTNAGAEGSQGLPSGVVQIRNDVGLPGFIGAAPPSGDAPHRYVTTVHAVDVERLDIDENVTPAIVGFNLRFHTLARAQIVPIFGS
jgi:Raf kinase inhibitor-like YbhB/YbcL family protein